MAGLFGNYNPYLQNYGQTYSPSSYQPQNYNTIQPAPSYTAPTITLTYASEEEIKAMRLPVNSQVSAFDREKPILYIKTSDSVGGSKTEKFEYRKIEENKPEEVAENKGQFVLKDDLKGLATKEDLKDIVKREDLSGFVSKEEFSQFISRFKGLGGNNGENDSRSSETVQQ